MIITKGRGFKLILNTAVADAVVNAILQDIKNAMYFLVILDCTLDKSHKEQVSLTIWYASDGVNVEESEAIHERLIEFLSVKSTIGQDLCNALVNKLEKLE